MGSLELPTAQTVIAEWQVSDQARNFGSLSAKIKLAITLWENAAKTFKVKPHEIEEGQYWTLREALARANDLQKIALGSYVVTMSMPDKVTAGD